jgi:predicted acyltransferase
MKYASTQRFLTLDIFRGLTIFVMIIVNTPGSGAEPFAPLLHADWHGCTLTDLVFPSFLFAAGASMPFSLAKLESTSSGKVWLKVFRRAALIFIIGLFLVWYTSMHIADDRLRFVQLENLRIMAVLQRIALCYLFAFMIIWRNPDQVVIVACVLLLTGYWQLLLIFGDSGAWHSIEGNAVRKLDLLVLGENHMYREKGIAFDPEGLLSTLPATVNVLGGYLTTRLLMKRDKTAQTSTVLLLIGAVLVTAGLVWDQVLPINKKLWTSSYVVYTIGIDLIVLSVLFLFIEVKKLNIGNYFFLVFGRNPLFLYVLSNLFLVFFIIPVGNTNFYEWINSEVYQQVANGATGSLLFALTFVMICWLFGLLLDKKRIYVRL